MKFCIIVLSVTLLVVCLHSFEVVAQPKQGDKTLYLSMNHFHYSNDTHQRCDSEGNNCSDYFKLKNLRLGLGFGGGYLLTDLIEAGLRVGVYKSQEKLEYTNSESWTEYSGFGFDGSIYGKLHIDLGSKAVPFVASGGGLNYQTGENKALNMDPVKGDVTRLFVFGQTGIDWYVGEKYAVSGSISIDYHRNAYDYKDSGTVDDEKRSGFSIWVGLGVATYF